MSAFPSDYILDQFGGLDAIRQQVDLARIRVAKSVLAQIAAGDRSATCAVSTSELGKTQQTLQVAELRALDLLLHWQRDARSQEGQEFRRCCSFAYDLRRSLPPPDDADEALKSWLLLSCAAVLGDRSADVRRYFREHPWAIPQPDAGRPNWMQLLFYTTAEAFLRVVRKQGWADLEHVAASVSSLREQQGQFEQAYLHQENGIRQTAALELVACYHLAKAVEVLALYVGTGEPARATDEVEFHVSRAERLIRRELLSWRCCSAGWGLQHEH